MGCSRSKGKISSEESARRSYTGHVAFSHDFSANEASRLGFFSVLNPPAINEHVVCYKQSCWLRRGVVKSVLYKVSDGSDGLAEGVEGADVTVLDDHEQTFQCWAAFLAPASHTDRSYSSIATTEEYLSSHFCSLLALANHDASHFVSKEDAKASCQEWLSILVDDHGQHVVVPSELQEELLHIFDEYEDPSIHLYTRQQPLVQGARFLNHTESRGHDYTLYYLALNNTLNHDTEASLRCAMPLIRRMMFLLLYMEVGQKRLHPGGIVYKGDCKAPDHQNIEKLKKACKERGSGAVIRFRQFQSTSSDKKIADKFRTRGGPADEGMNMQEPDGWLWIIDIPPNFWGARALGDVSKIQSEAETLFPPYSLFHVNSVSENSCHLEAVDRSEDREFERFNSRVFSEPLSPDLIRYDDQEMAVVPPSLKPTKVSAGYFLETFRKCSPDS